jgi:ABC-type nitrate/sulfonate/bicarbonate transport system permease component
MSASGSEARRALLGFLLGVALGALIGLTARRPPTKELA